MKAGFIGAGKVGFSLGKYLAEGGITLSGYYSQSVESAKDAADFTGSEYYRDLADLVKASDTIFVTVPDGTISDVWEKMRTLPIKDKNICHCSGSVSSAAFFDAEERGAYAYSVHPLYAVSDKYNSFMKLKEAYFAIEGSLRNLEMIKQSFENLGNKVIAIDTDKKALYHCAAVMVSNQMAVLLNTGAEMLTKCGFNREDAEKALAPLVIGNINNMVEMGPVKALTGPVERGDLTTIKSHIEILQRSSRDNLKIYKTLSRKLVDVAQKKHPKRDYEQIKKELEK